MTQGQIEELAQRLNINLATIRDYRNAEGTIHHVFDNLAPVEWIDWAASLMPERVTAARLERRMREIEAAERAEAERQECAEAERRERAEVERQEAERRREEAARIASKGRAVTPLKVSPHGRFAQRLLLTVLDS
jgi:hypothetical protein